MEKTMKVAVLKDIREIGYEHRPIPKIEKDEVLVKLEYVGICGSDLHFYEHGRIGDYEVGYPFVLGHEPGGIVIEVGDEVTHLKVGDRVALEPGKTCGKCEFCKTGRYNLCPDVIFFATPPYDGAFQEYVAHEADLCFKLPQNVSTLAGALIEPLAVGIHAANQGEAQAGQRAVITGAGAIGLVSLLALKYKGISEIIVIDIIQKRLDKAIELGATHVINATAVDPVEKVMEITKGKGCDLGIETAGTETTTNGLIHMVKKGSNIVLVGYGETGLMNLEMSLALDKEITFKTVFRYKNIYPEAIDAVAGGKIDLENIVSNVFDFDDTVNAMKQSVENKSDIVKSVIKF
ncbi:MAG TPA: NAD(P)-dependent alcohol dehydrogenase [Clostridia bacterium]|nr:NAD(P)-dependent alcohol dehydrogenase [Clostridia bacterium]